MLKVKSILLTLFSFLIPFITFAQDTANATELTIAQKIDAFFSPIAKEVSDIVFYTVNVVGKEVPLVLFVLIGGAIFFTIYFKFANFTLIKTAIGVVKGDYDELDHHGADVAEGDSTPGGDIFETIGVEGAEGEVSHFQALTAALSATVGLGNIAGVAVAVSIGGPGATFWMILAGFLGMASKFVECTLGVKYREVTEDGTVHGGPMYYLSKGLKEMKMGFIGKVLAIFFAIMCVGGSFGGGNMFQANQAANQMIEKFGMVGGNAGFWIGVVMAVIVGLVIIGGIKRIGSVTEKVVPFMAAIYVGTALIIILMNITLVPEAFGMIFGSAFNLNAGIGGFIGILIVGFQRAAFSNEAGVGSAAIAHSAVKTKYPASEGIVALLEPLIDTVIICTMTALVLIITNIEGGFINYGETTVGGIELTGSAFDSAIPGSSWILMFAAVLFAISTMLSWSYYGLQAWKFLFGKAKSLDIVYKLIFLGFVIVGSSIELGSVIAFSDAMIFAMVFPNVIGLILLSPKVREELKTYQDKIKAFKASKQ
ncbi:MAG: alanine/glycine:cation symporter family protein [Vicingaceae bacterium]